MLKNITQPTEPIPPVCNYIVKQDLCIGCGSCASVCPTDAVKIDYTAYIDSNECIFCGSCFWACMVGTIG